MQIAVVCRETIKPSSTTPQHLRNLKLSFLDQLNIRAQDLRILLFYSAQGDASPFQNTDMISVLKKSLSRTLDEFYPLAGRLNSDQSSIDCNDSGVEFIEARVNAPFVLHQLLSDPNAEELYQLYPPGARAAAGDYLCTVQVTIFEGCGSMVLGVSISHVIGDASALSVFVDTWAAIARGDKIVSPKFGFADIISPRDVEALRRSILEGIQQEIQQEIPKPVQKIVTKRFVFNKSEVAALISNCADQSSTRVQVVCAFIFMCSINVLRSESSKPVILNMLIGWRRRMTPPVPSHHVGNLAFSSLSKEITEPESFPRLVARVRQMIQNIDSEYLKNMLADDAKMLVSILKSYFAMKHKIHGLGISSWCGLQFYEADFGWGRPIWTAMFALNIENFITLLDTKDGEGVEVWVPMNEDDMTKFESEHELLLSDLMSH